MYITRVWNTQWRHRSHRAPVENRFPRIGGQQPNVVWPDAHFLYPIPHLEHLECGTRCVCVFVSFYAGASRAFTVPTVPPRAWSASMRYAAPVYALLVCRGASHDRLSDWRVESNRTAPPHSEHDTTRRRSSGARVIPTTESGSLPRTLGRQLPLLPPAKLGAQVRWFLRDGRRQWLVCCAFL
jgi:hypothetical protein